MVSKSKLSLLSFFVLIIVSNFLIYRLEIMQPLPDGIVIATLFDFLIFIPLLAYLFVIRKRYSLKYLPIVVILGYGFVNLIVPKSQLSSYSFINYFLIACEGVFVILELYIFYKLVRKLPRIIKKYRENKSEIPYFQFRLERAMTFKLSLSRIQEIIVSELTVFYYALFSWNRKRYLDQSNSQLFTYHKKTSAIALYIMLIHALILESVGFHFLLHSWKPIFSVIALILNVYALLILIAHIQAIRNCPFIVTGQSLHIQVGMMKQLTVSLDDIKSIVYLKKPGVSSKNEIKEVFNAILPDFIADDSIIEIEFFSKQQAKLMYGFKQNVIKLHLRPDEMEKFYELISSKVNCKSK